MEDIKILEEFIKNCKTEDPFTIYFKEECRAIQNLIARYKELEKYKRYYENEKVIWSRKDYIPKSKVKEKIEELNKNIVDAKAGDYDFIGECRIKKQVLQELLED